MEVLQTRTPVQVAKSRFSPEEWSLLTQVQRQALVSIATEEKMFRTMSSRVERRDEWKGLSGLSEEERYRKKHYRELVGNARALAAQCVGASFAPRAKALKKAAADAVCALELKLKDSKAAATARFEHESSVEGTAKKAAMRASSAARIAAMATNLRDGMSDALKEEQARREVEFFTRTVAAFGLLTVQPADSFVVGDGTAADDEEESGALRRSHTYSIGGHAKLAKHLAASANLVIDRVSGGQRPWVFVNSSTMPIRVRLTPWADTIANGDKGWSTRVGAKGAIGVAALFESRARYEVTTPLGRIAFYAVMCGTSAEDLRYVPSSWPVTSLPAAEGHDINALQSVVISGVVGEHDFCNGEYVLHTARKTNGFPMFLHTTDGDAYLYRGDTGHWHVNCVDAALAGVNTGWIASANQSTTPLGLPWDISDGLAMVPSDTIIVNAPTWRDVTAGEVDVDECAHIQLLSLQTT